MVTDENVEANTAALDVAAEAVVVIPGAADESAGTPTATLDVAVETILSMHPALLKRTLTLPTPHS
eukprot:720642-Pleurochrysis_carterae.AAC.1